MDDATAHVTHAIQWNQWVTLPFSKLSTRPSATHLQGLPCKAPSSATTLPVQLLRPIRSLVSAAEGDGSVPGGSFHSNILQALFTGVNARGPRVVIQGLTISNGEGYVKL